MPAPIKILYDDAGVIAVNKPPELATQAPPGIESLHSYLRRQLDLVTGYLEFPHRLDRGVGGVILAATSKKVARLLSDQFATRKTEKRYVAWLSGVFEPVGDSDGAAETTMWRDHLRKVDGEARVELCAADAPGAKLAETWIESVVPHPTGTCCLATLRPITGRMHQLRIQAASRGHAILGDPLYSSGSSPDVGAGRIELHACELTFRHPKTGRRVTVRSDMDAAMQSRF